MIDRVGILTFHRSENYGSVLQAYALARVLSDMGSRAEIVDYAPPSQKERHAIFSKVVSARSLARNARSLLFYPLLSRKASGFERFIAERLPVSADSYRATSDFRDIESRYDALVCGSDQIWNVRAFGFTETFLLPFQTSARKIAYAPSLNRGDFADTADAERYRELISDFDALSVREHSGKEKLESLLGRIRDIPVVADPVLLLEGPDYDPICADHRPARPYIFLYSIDFESGVVDAASALARETGLPVYTLFTASRSYAMAWPWSGVRFSRQCAPEDFIALVKNAEYVVTNSFHATAFSVLFHKRFYAVCRTNEDGTARGDTRIQQLLGVLGLEGCIVRSGERLDPAAGEDIDYDAVDALRRQYAASSMAFLSESLA
jgi:hypothetical protein